MFTLPFIILAAAVIAVLTSFAFLYLYWGQGDRSRLPERTVWYLGVATLVLFTLLFGERAEEPPQNLQIILIAFVGLSALLAVRHTWRAMGNLLRHLAREEAKGMRHRRERTPHPG